MDLATIKQLLDLANSAWELYERLKSLVEDKMAGILSKVGDTEFDAAKRHLENIKTMWANNPRLSQQEKQKLADGYVVLAIGDLERAHDKFVRSGPKGLPRFLKGSRLGSGYAERAEAYGKACEAALLQSICYKYVIT